MSGYRVSDWKIGLLVVGLLVMLLIAFDGNMRQGRPTLDVDVREVVLESGHFSMTASQGGNSGTSFRHSDYEIEDGALYVTLYSGLVYGDYRADVMQVDIRTDGINAIRQVYLRDGSVKKLIYSK